MNMLYRAGGDVLINNDLRCEIGLFADEDVKAALADGWCLTYAETANETAPDDAPKRRGRPPKAA